MLVDFSAIAEGVCRLEEVFSRVTQPRELRSINLHQNKITAVLAAAVEGTLPRLRELNLSANAVKHVESAALERMPQLASLDLSCNLLNDLFFLRPDLRMMDTLRVLLVPFNELTTLDGIEALRALETLDARENQIASTETGGLSALAEITTLQEVSLQSADRSRANPVCREAGYISRLRAVTAPAAEAGNLRMLDGRSIDRAQLHAEELAAAEDHTRALEATIQELREELEQVRNDLQRDVDQEQERGEVDGKVSDMQQLLDLQKEELAQASSRTAEAEERADDLSRTVESLREELLQARSDLEHERERERQREQSDDSQAKAAQQLLDMQKEELAAMAARETSMEERAQQLANELTAVAMRATAAEDRAQELERKLVTAASRATRAESRAQELDVALRELHAALEQQKAAADAAASAQRDNEGQSGEEEHQSTDSGGRDDASAAESAAAMQQLLQLQKEELAQTSTRMAAAEERVNELSGTVASLREELQQTQNTLQNERKQQRDKDVEKERTSATETAAMQQLLQLQKEELALATSRTAEAEERADELRGTVESLREELLQARSDLEHERERERQREQSDDSQAKAAQQLLGMQKEELAAMAARATDAEESASKLQAAMNELQEQLRQARGELEHEHSKKHRRREDTESSQATQQLLRMQQHELAATSTARAIAEERVNQLETAVRQLVQKLQSQIARSKDAKKVRARLTRQLQDAQQLTQEQQQALDTAVASREAAEARAARLESELQEARTDLQAAQEAAEAAAALQSVQSAPEPPPRAQPDVVAQLELQVQVKEKQLEDQAAKLTEARKRWKQRERALVADLDQLESLQEQLEDELLASQEEVRELKSHLSQQLSVEHHLQLAMQELGQSVPSSRHTHSARTLSAAAPAPTTSTAAVPPPPQSFPHASTSSTA